MKNVILTIIAVLFSLTSSVAANADDVSITVENTNTNSITATLEQSAPREGTPVATSIRKNLQEIKELQDELLKCKVYSFRNLELRHGLVSRNVIAYFLSNDEKYLKEAIQHASIAEGNYINGHDIKQNMPIAQYSMTDTYLYWRDCIMILQGPKAAAEFFIAKNLKQLLQ